MDKKESRFTAEEFEVFCKEFKRWQRYLGLDGYQVYFQHKPLDVFADICINQTCSIATVRVNSQLPPKDIPFADPAAHAQHEVLHLLLGRLEAGARARYAVAENIDEALEELCRRIARVIKSPDGEV